MAGLIDLKIAKLSFFEKLITKTYDLLKLCVISLVAFFIVRELAQMVQDLANARPECLRALVGVLAQLKVPYILHGLVTAICGTGWAVEKHRNRKLTKSRDERDV